MNKSEVRLRFAPSPTGELHIGGARTALFAYLFAKKNDGKLILRIEDTDQKRYVAGSIERLLESLNWLGIEFDEGVQLTRNEELKTKNQSLKHKINNSIIENCKLKTCLAGRRAEKFDSKGSYGPYIQSERLGIYQEYAQRLIEDGHAYYCFCSEERLEKMRDEQIKNKQAPMYDKTCLKLSGNEIEKRIKRGDKYVIRLKVPEGGKSVFTDMIRGYIEFDNFLIDDQILIKSDGMPTYHLAVVVDDHLMAITHVFRGEEWISSTPKQILLYKALGWDMPEFAHLPTILSTNKKKLSKRDGSVSVEEFKKLGYLPDALVNFIALIGWSPKNDREFFSLAKLEKEFDIVKVNKAGGIFDREKLNHFNHRYIQNLKVHELLDLIINNQEKKLLITEIDKCFLERIISIVQERMVRLSDFEELAKPFITQIKYDKNLLVFKKSTEKLTLAGLRLALDKLSELSDNDWEKIENLNDALLQTVSIGEFTNGDVFWPIRVALSGLEKSPSPTQMLWVLGKNESISRINLAINKLEKK